ncbi:hypothetical protein CHS0354_013626 [Potamilus streckersoni]|uniref:Uncharacterized protein n=1 Tax=Potamilus streckersoni TaxID=2493646 RepID=A0AAE0VXL6_9BIVA|nr:hypothetical protein CHS0354_013626 [Potamilus streckersoni]
MILNGQPITGLDSSLRSIKIKLRQEKEIDRQTCIQSKLQSLMREWVETAYSIKSVRSNMELSKSKRWVFHSTNHSNAGVNDIDGAVIALITTGHCKPA